MRITSGELCIGGYRGSITPGVVPPTRQSRNQTVSTAHLYASYPNRGRRARYPGRDTPVPSGDHRGDGWGIVTLGALTPHLVALLAQGCLIRTSGMSLPSRRNCAHSYSICLCMCIAHLRGLQFKSIARCRVKIHWEGPVQREQTDC